MSSLTIKANPAVEEKFNAYPEHIKPKMLRLRKLVFEVAEETESIQEIEETLKWGEPSYLTKKGSTLRMDWKAKLPDQYALYFKCTSLLVKTFQTVYKDRFQFEGTRAIVFDLKDDIPEEEVKSCIKAALTYHSIKQLPFLGL